MIGTNRFRSRTQNRGIYQSYQYTTTTRTDVRLIRNKNEQMWDVEDPNFRDKLYAWIRHRKPLPVNPLKKTDWDLSGVRPVGLSYNSGTGLTYDYRFIPVNSWAGTPSGTIVAPSGTVWLPRNLSIPYPPTLSDSLKNSVLQKALANARTQSWDVGTFVAELHKTSTMITRAGRTLMRRQENILSKGVKSYDEFASAWLEYRYGWRILYYDIMEANESLLRLKGLLPLSNRYTSYVEKLDQTITTSSAFTRLAMSVDGTVSGTNYHRCVMHQTVDAVTSARAGVFLELDPGQLAFADPFNTLLEITPYALVVNWFLNIKDLVAAWSPFATGRIVHGFVTESQEIRQRQFYTNLTVSGFPSSHAGKNSWTWDMPESNAIRYIRTRERRQPVMNLRFRLNMDWANLVDLLSILAVKHMFIRNLRGR